MRRPPSRWWALLVPLLLVGAACGDDGGQESSESVTPVDPEDIETDIDIEVPEGWQPVPLDRLGFGMAIPPGWEALVLDEAGVDTILQANPQVPGFTASATSAYQAGAVFYAAGVEGGTSGDGDSEGGNEGEGEAEGEQPVTDLKVFVEAAGDIEDVEALETHVEEMVAEASPTDLTVTAVEDAEDPTVDARYRATVARPHQDGGGDDPEASATEEIDVFGLQRSVLASSGAVYSFIVIAETAEGLDATAADILDTVVLAS